MNHKTHLGTFLLGLVVSAVCVALVLTHVDLGQVWRTSTGLKGKWILAALVVSVACLLLRGWRWREIFPPTSRPGFWRFVKIMAIGTMANNVLPGRVGDLARCTLIGSELSISGASEGLASLGVEKVLDGLALIAVLVFSAVFLTPPRWIWELTLVAGVVFAAALALLIAIRFRYEWVASAMVRLAAVCHAPGLGARLAQLVRSFGGALRSINSAGQLFAILSLTAVIWVLESVMVWVMATSLSISIGISASFVVMAVLGLGFMIPAAPAGLGTYEAFGVAAFTAVGVAASGGLAVTLLLHTWTFVANNAFGLICLPITGVRFSTLPKAGEVAEEALESPAVGTRT